MMKKVAIISTSRSDFGLLEPVIKLIHEDSALELCLLVTGSHLSPQYGNTIQHIKYPIAERIETILANDSPVAISKAAGLTYISFGEAYERHRPDMVLCLGDRFECMAAVVPAYIMGIPIAHIHGGEITEGSYDNGFRHSISHMASLHFPAAREYEDRLCAMGVPGQIHMVGALGCDGLNRGILYKPSHLIVMYYPETKGGNSLDVIDLLDSLPMKSVVHVFGSRPDVGVNRFQYHTKDLPRQEFIDLLKRAEAVIGNSSCGIIEAPALGTPTINIGNRQKGRLIAGSIIQAEASKEGIQKAIERLRSDEFGEIMASDYYQPYKGENVAGKIVEIIKRAIL
jgi:GDP/UDP-N,N'-diacetylbacillosamine 2-epimerase (hydrolysing)